MRKMPFTTEFRSFKNKTFELHSLTTHNNHICARKWARTEHQMWMLPKLNWAKEKNEKSNLLLRRWMSINPSWKWIRIPSRQRRLTNNKFQVHTCVRKTWVVCCALIVPGQFQRIFIANLCISCTPHHIRWGRIDGWMDNCWHRM